MHEINGKLFDWDTKKNTINIIKHGISFKEAATVFSDKSAKYFDDDTHSMDEERYVVIGKSKRLKILMVCHCYRENDEIIRLISARKANKQESKTYVGGKQNERTL